MATTNQTQEKYQAGSGVSTGSMNRGVRAALLRRASCACDKPGKDPTCGCVSVNPNYDAFTAGTVSTVTMALSRVR